jgi:hypothetical protein
MKGARGKILFRWILCGLLSFVVICSRLNAGVGFSYGGVRIDYSYSEFRLFNDMINRASIGFEL